jgi:hypothetical protein
VKLQDSFMDEQGSSGPEAYTLANLLMILAAIEMESREAEASLLGAETSSEKPNTTEPVEESRLPFDSNRSLADEEESQPAAVDFSADDMLDDAI